MSERHSRQARLFEVGEEGQARVGALSHTVRGEVLAALVEARYLAGAGVREIGVESDVVGAAAREIDASARTPLAASPAPPTEPPAWAATLASPARDVAVGAHRALLALRRAIFQEPRDDRP
jgi:hypothetical protein